MAAIEYVDTTIGAGGNDGTSWANAWRTDPTALASALASCDAGGTIYIQSDSVLQFPAHTTLSSANGVAANPCTITSVKNFNEPPVEGDFETMTVGGGNLDAKTNGAFDITLAGWDIWVGMELICGGDLIIGDNDIDVKLINCKTIVDDNLLLGSLASTDSNVFWENVDYVQVTAGYCSIGTSFVWLGGSFSFGGGNISTPFFRLTVNKGGIFHVFDIDFQDLDAGDYLISDVNTSWDILIKRCKIPAACNYMNNGPTGAPCKVRFHSVDDGNLIHRFKEYYFEGNISDDVAVYRDNAATYDGTNEYSVKMVSNASAKEWTRPLRFKLAEIWCAANPTLTVELNTDNAVLQNDEFWLEIEYPDGTTGALGKIDRTSRPATILTAPANLTISAVAWTEGFGTEKPQKIAETISGGQAGIHTVWACLAKPSTTVYVCPKIDVS